MQDMDECTFVFELVGSLYCLCKQHGSKQPSGKLEGRIERWTMYIPKIHRNNFNPILAICCDYYILL